MIEVIVMEKDRLAGTNNKVLAQVDRERFNNRIYKLALRYCGDVHMVSDELDVPVEYVRRVWGKAKRAWRSSNKDKGTRGFMVDQLENGVRAFIARAVEFERVLLPNLVQFISPCHRVPVYYSIVDGYGCDGSVVNVDEVPEGTDKTAVTGPFCKECDKKVNSIRRVNASLATAINRFHKGAREEVQGYIEFGVKLGILAAETWGEIQPLLASLDSSPTTKFVESFEKTGDAVLDAPILANVRAAAIELGPEHAEALEIAIRDKDPRIMNHVSGVQDLLSAVLDKRQAVLIAAGNRLMKEIDGKKKIDPA
jgi:hypothetical protein